MDEPIRYGVVGLGRAGWNIHVKQLRGRGDARIVAVADPVPQRRQEAAAEFGCKTYTSLSRLLKQDDIEVVIIATPSVQHAPDSIRSLKAGKHVIVEKPMALSLAQADRMIRTAEQAGRRLFVHHNLRFNREFTYYQDVIRSGILGRIFHIRKYTSGFVRRNDWQTLAKNGGGILNNQCSHFLDQILQFLAGRVMQVMGDLQQIASAGDVEDHVKAFMRADDGCTVDLEISTAENVAMPLPSWIICGTCGTLTSDGKTATIRWFDPQQAPPLEAIDGPRLDRRYGNDERLPWQEKVEPAQGPDAGTFYDNVAAVLRRGAAMRVTPESVREVMRVIEMIRKGTAFPGRPARRRPAPKPAAVVPSNIGG